MPRTKVHRNAAIKRNRNSVTKEAESACLHAIDLELEDKLCEDNIIWESKIQQLDNAIQNIKVKLPAKYLQMTMGELEEINLAADKSCFATDSCATLEITNNNQRNNTIQHTKKYSKDDEGK